MNASEPQEASGDEGGGGGGAPHEYVMATKWMIEGFLLPLVGFVGIVGKIFISLCSLLALADQ